MPADEPAKAAGNVRRIGIRLAGLVALACYATHAGFHWANGRWPDMLWACHLAAAIVAVGLLARSPTINGVGLLLLCLGTPLWLADLAAGGEFYPTSLLTHVGALAAGLYGTVELGMPHGCWWKTTVTLAALIGLCRVLTPDEANVNMAFAVPANSSGQFDSHAAYLATTMTIASGYFLVAEFAVRGLLRGGSAWQARRTAKHE